MPLGLVSKTAPLNVSRKNMYILLTRNFRPGSGDDRFGKWEPLSTYGFILICPSKKEAVEAMLLAGGQMYPWPSGDITDAAYEHWLLDNHFRIEPYEATGKGEVIFADWIRGWIPGAEELRTGVCANAAYLELFQDHLRRAIGD